MFCNLNAIFCWNAQTGPIPSWLRAFPERSKKEDIVEIKATNIKGSKGALLPNPMGYLLAWEDKLKQLKHQDDWFDTI